MNIFREITPLNEDDCFTIFTREKDKFNYPLHTHDEYEINLICNAKGAKRIIGFHEGIIDDIELVMVNGNLAHGWFTHQCKSKNIEEITIQFHKNLFDPTILNRHQFRDIHHLLSTSEHGILFQKDTAYKFKERLQRLYHLRGLSSVLELISILHDLSTQPMELISKNELAEFPELFNSRRIEKAFIYIRNNYSQNITLKDISREINMPEVSCSRFIKKRTGRTFIEILNGIRLSHAARQLVESTQSVAEIAYQCGFNNISYFNRVFRRNNECTPVTFRRKYSENKVYI